MINEQDGKILSFLFFAKKDVELLWDAIIRKVIESYILFAIE